jgi:hypothetical protein
MKMKCGELLLKMASELKSSNIRYLCNLPVVNALKTTRQYDSLNTENVN